MRVRTTRLPLGYRELDYIKNERNSCYFIIDYYPNGNTIVKMDLKMEGDFQATESGPGHSTLIHSLNTDTISGNHPVFTANFGNGSGQGSNFYLWASDKTYSEGASIYMMSIPTNVSKSRNILTFKSGESSWGTINRVNGSLTHQLNDKLKLFAYQDLRYFVSYNYYLYNTKIYEGDNLLLDLIPCERALDNHVGLYDIINGKFYENQGSDSYIKGPYKSINGSGQISLGPRLPLEYQEVDYIESTGTQYINVGLTADITQKFEIDIKLNSISSNTNIIGGWNDYLYSQLCTNSNVNGWIVQWGADWNYYGTVDTNRHKHILDLIKRSYKVDNTTYIVDTSITSVSTTQSLRLFAGNANGSIIRSTSANLYSCKIYDNYILVRNFVPCYRKSDNVIGLYDLAGKQFYTNQGTGTFLKGNNVSNTISCKIAGGSSDIYYGYNQLCINGNFIDSTNWSSNTTKQSLSFSNNTIHINVTENFTHDFANVQQNVYSRVVNGHKYLLTCYKKSTQIRDTMGLGITNTTVDSFNRYLTAGIRQFMYAFVTVIEGTHHYLQLYGFNYSGQQITTSDSAEFDTVQCIDLTEWFGAGKEPSTVQEFKEKFTKEYYGFCPTPIKLTRYQIEALPSYGYNQMVDNGDFSKGSTGWTPYNSNNISVNVENGELTSTFKTQLNIGAGSRYSWGFRCYTTKPVRYHKHLILVNFYTSFAGNYAFDFNNTSDGKIFSITTDETNKWITKGIIYPTNYDNNATQCIFYPQSQTENMPIGTTIKCRKFMIIDLTDWYGEGNEPTTIEEFKATFPNKYYPYSKKRLLNKYMINKLIN